jgi:hypothetical protein
MAVITRGFGGRRRDDTSLRLPPVSDACNGMPCASVIR